MNCDYNHNSNNTRIKHRTRVLIPRNERTLANTSSMVALQVRFCLWFTDSALTSLEQLTFFSLFYSNLVTATHFFNGNPFYCFLRPPGPEAISWFALPTTAQPCLDLTQNDDQRRIMKLENILGNHSFANDAARYVCVKAWRTSVCLEFAIGRLGVTNAQAFWLVQVVHGGLIGQARMSLRGQTFLDA